MVSRLREGSEAPGRGFADVLRPVEGEPVQLLDGAPGRGRRGPVGQLPVQPMGSFLDLRLVFGDQVIGQARGQVGRTSAQEFTRQIAPACSSSLGFGDSRSGRSRTTPSATSRASISRSSAATSS